MKQSNQPTKLTKKYLESLPEWMRNVLLNEIGMRLGYEILNCKTDYSVPFNELPGVRVWGDSFIIWVKPDGIMDVFDKFNRYVNCTVNNIRSGDCDSIRDDVVEEVDINYEVRKNDVEMA